jgi:hypothetical protein
MRLFPRGASIAFRLRSVLLAAAIGAGLLLAAPTLAAVIQTEGVRITVLSQIEPYKLPRTHSAPIAVFIAGHLENPEGGIPPQLQKLTVKVNRHGLLQSQGLPVCGISKIQPASTQQALRACGSSLIGSGQFWANIVFADQGAYPTQGRILIFNGRKGNKPLLLAQIFTIHPFTTSFVISFTIKHISQGPYGTELSASLPQALGTWGYLNRIKLTLKRKYTYHGRELSYFNAGCPAAKGAKRTVFPLAYATFTFAGQPPIGTTVPKSCGVRE